MTPNMQLEKYIRLQEEKEILQKMARLMQRAGFKITK